MCRLCSGFVQLLKKHVFWKCYMVNKIIANENTTNRKAKVFFFYFRRLPPNTYIFSSKQMYGDLETVTFWSCTIYFGSQLLQQYNIGYLFKVIFSSPIYVWEEGVGVGPVFINGYTSIYIYIHQYISVSSSLIGRKFWLDRLLKISCFFK